MLAHSSTRLSNGLEVVTVEQPHLHSASVSLFVKCGSRHEASRQWGLSHLVEHMLFRGSQRFPTSRSLAQAFERSGGTLQASTWRDHTSLTTSVHPSRLRTVLTALNDMVQSPCFEGLDVERDIVEEELQGDLDEDGQDTDLSNASRATIWRDHPMGRRVTGSLETLRSFSLDDVRQHHGEHYVGANTVLCVAGRIDGREVLDMAAETFAGLPAGSRADDGIAARFAPGSRINTRRREGSQLAIQLTFEALPDVHADFPAQTLLASILDEGMGSRLQQLVCERGLVYELTTGLDCYADCGLYDIEMKVAPRRAASAIAATLEVLEVLCAQGISDEELEVARERSLHELEFRIDSTEELCVQYGMNSLLGELQSVEREAARIAEVRPADLLRVAREMFGRGRVHTTLMGPVERANMRRIEKLIEGFSGG